MTIFFTSDTHFDHKNILKFCPARADRWPASVAGPDQYVIEEMNEGIIKRWNSTVSPSDTVYHLGDFAFGRADATKTHLSRLNGKIHLVSGNHDKVVHDNADVRAMFESVKDYREITHNKTKIVMFHFPILAWHKNHYGSIHLHGHCHDNLPQYGGKRFDVGIDSSQITGVAEHRPFSLEEILTKADTVAIETVDHHDAQTPR